MFSENLDRLYYLECCFQVLTALLSPWYPSNHSVTLKEVKGLSVNTAHISIVLLLYYDKGVWTRPDVFNGKIIRTYTVHTVLIAS